MLKNAILAPVIRRLDSPSAAHVRTRLSRVERLRCSSRGETSLSRTSRLFFNTLLVAAAFAWPGGVTTLFAAPPGTGLYYEASSSTRTDQGAVTGARVAVKGWVQGSSAKVVIAGSDQPAMTVGTWLVTRDGGKTVHVVDPGHKTYMTLNPAGLASGLGRVFKELGGVVQLSVENPEARKTTETSGPKMLGYQTTHSTYEISYTLVMNIVGTVKRVQTETREDLWTADSVGVSVDGVWLSTRPPKTGIPAVDDVVQKKLGKTAAGFPLKRKIVTTTTTHGRRTTTTSTTGITKLDKRQVDEAIFAISPDYTEQKAPGLAELLK